MPAIASKAAFSDTEVLTIIGSTQPSAWSTHCAPVAAKLHSNHTNMYAATKLSHRADSPLRAHKTPKVRTVGTAEGSIIEAIMIAHMAMTASRLAVPQ